MKRQIQSFACALGIFSCLTYNAQTNNTIRKNYCGTEVPNEQWEQELQEQIKEYLANNSAQKTQALYTIPVIIHVIHGGEAVGVYPNLANGQLHSQIRVLNEDFAGIGLNSGNYPATAFTNWASNQSLPVTNLDGLGRVKLADCGIQFCMATKDPQGLTLAEPGIERINYVSKGWTNPTSFNSSNSFQNYMNGTVKANSIWDPTKYFNIWVSDINLSAVPLLGYATFPAGSTLGGINSFNGTATTDGVWCYSKAFGSSSTFPAGYYDSNNDKGRTATHEVGHWVGLRHIWGDGVCANDFCNDTPPASGQNFGGGIYPHKVASCATNNPDGEMYMNFMDYVDDLSKYMFSPDQATRVKTVMQNSPFRKQLGTHNLCSVEAFAATAAFNLPGSVCGTSAILTPSNNSKGVPAPSYTWSAVGASGITFSPNPNDAAVAINVPASGIYTITLTADNGTISTVTRTVNVIPHPVVLISTPLQSVCKGDVITFTATGANFYGWQPSNKTGAVVSYVANATQEFTVSGTGAGNCKSVETIEIEVVDCVSYVGIEENANGSSKIPVYPNPISNKLIINTSGLTINENIKVSLTDLTGKVLVMDSIKVNNQSSSEINTTDLSRGVYILKLTTSDNKTQIMKVVKD